MKTASSRASRLHSDGMNAESSTTKSRFDERADFSARIVSLPFIRNHAFARNDTKGAVFRAFPAFSKAFLEMPKKKTVNLSIENTILCLTFAFRKQIRFLDGRLFFEYSDALFEGLRKQNWGTLLTLSQKNIPQLVFCYCLLSD